MPQAKPVGIKCVELTSGFWKTRQDTNRKVTLRMEHEQCKRTGRIDAFRLDWKPGMPNKPHNFWDSDVAKWIEAAGYSLARTPDPDLEKCVDDVIDLVVSAQQPDGYLNIWGIGHYGPVSTEKIAELRNGGATVWFTTDGQMCTDTPYCAVERLLPHYCFKYGVQAYEFWGVSWTTYDPFRFGWHAFIHQSDQPGKSYYVRYPNGDGYLLYPGPLVGHPDPVSSVRLEQAREGGEDYEYLHLLRSLIAKAKAAGKDTAQAEQAMERANRLVTIPNAGGRYSSKILPEPQTLYEVKEAVATAIEAMGR